MAGRGRYSTVSINIDCNVAESCAISHLSFVEFVCVFNQVKRDRCFYAPLFVNHFLFPLSCPFADGLRIRLHSLNEVPQPCNVPGRL